MRRLLFPLANLRTRPFLRGLLGHPYSVTLAILLLAHVGLVAMEGDKGIVLAPIILLSLYVTGLLLMGDRSPFCLVILGLGLTALAVCVANAILGGNILLPVALVCHIVFLSLLSAFLLKRLFRARQVTLDHVMAGIIVFLLMAGIWAQFYALTLLADPAALSAPGNSLAAHPYSTIYYFSITTLTTAGLG
ncbi:MAG TPA: hypothetical protein VN436_12855, partial [Holophaga sp.]|nr:hypothetical protein [Holophaga sp.]